MNSQARDRQSFVIRQKSKSFIKTGPKIPRLFNIKLSIFFFFNNLRSLHNFRGIFDLQDYIKFKKKVKELTAQYILGFAFEKINKRLTCNRKREKHIKIGTKNLGCKIMWKKLIIKINFAAL